MFHTSARRGGDYITENYYTDKNSLTTEALTSMQTLEEVESGTMSASAAAKQLEAESTAIVLEQETAEGEDDKDTAL